MADLDWIKDGGDWPNRSASSLVEAASLRWHVQRMGSPNAPPLVLVHGTGAATHSWAGLMPLLARHYDVIAMDLPGHGFTQTPMPHRISLNGMAADVAELLRKLNVSPRIAVGHSAGAAILARMALDGKIAPDVLVSLNGAFLPYGGAAATFFSPLAKMLTLNPFVPRLFAWQASSRESVGRLLGGTGSSVDAATIGHYAKLIANPSHVAAALRMMANWDLAPLVRDLPKLQARFVLVAADNDRAISPQVARDVQKLVPGAIVEPAHGLGHLAHEERPDIIAALIEKHVQQGKGDESPSAAVR